MQICKTTPAPRRHESFQRVLAVPPHSDPRKIGRDMPHVKGSVASAVLQDGNGMLDRGELTEALMKAATSPLAAGSEGWAQ